QHVATGRGIWVIATLLISLFVGGLVTSRTTVGEKKGEAMMYGVLVWGALVAMMAGLATTRQSAYLPFSSYLLQAGETMSSPQNTLTPERAREVFGPNVTQEQIDRANRPYVVTGNRVEAAWWAFAGIGFSLFAAIAGALVGAGPELILRYWAGRRLVATPPPHA
ncbi:MAG TPA: hypothetical protein VEL76_17560, partial [Gemmataceae bacterium]|nr:hypothetical protein [Gemmataceae bacterium]